MNMPITIDASVFVSAFVPTEPAHQASKTFMLGMRERSVPIVVPFLVLPEIAGALARGYGQPEFAKAFVLELRNLSNITFVDLDESVANLSVDIATNNRLRGSDAVYAAVALRFGTELVTLDKEQLIRLRKIIIVHEP
jgi:predicted nucleic acid-binding protein